MSDFSFRIDVSECLAAEIDRLSIKHGKTSDEIFEMATSVLVGAREARQGGHGCGDWPHCACGEAGHLPKNKAAQKERGE